MPHEGDGTHDWFDRNFSWDDQNYCEKGQIEKLMRTILVPPGHVWLESDCLLRAWTLVNMALFQRTGREVALCDDYTAINQQERPPSKTTSNSARHGYSPSS